MTVDDLVELTQALLDEAGFSLASLRNGGEALSGLSDDQFLLATRFISGERPAENIPGYEPDYRSRRQRIVPMLSEDERAERLAQLEELDEETPPLSPQSAPPTGPREMFSVDDGVKSW